MLIFISLILATYRLATSETAFKNGRAYMQGHVSADFPRISSREWIRIDGQYTVHFESQIIYNFDTYIC